MWESLEQMGLKSHENINKVRKLAAALLDEDLEKAQSFYSPTLHFMT